MALHHLQSGEVVDLASGEYAGRTHALIKTSKFETFLRKVGEGETIPEHHVAGYVTIQCVAGHVVLKPLDSELRAGEWLYLDRATSYSVRAMSDAMLLVTILFDETSAD